MKKWIELVVVLVTLASSWILYSRSMQAGREASYETKMLPFRRDLRLGMSKVDVQNYLHSRDVSCPTVHYGGRDGDTCEIEIGEEPAGLLEGFVCEPWTVYLALELTGADKLRDIHIRKIGTCL